MLRERWKDSDVNCESGLGGEGGVNASMILASLRISSVHVSEPMSPLVARNPHTGSAPLVPASDRVFQPPISPHSYAPGQTRAHRLVADAAASQSKNCLLRHIAAVELDGSEITMVASSARVGGHEELHGQTRTFECTFQRAAQRDEVPLKPAGCPASRPCGTILTCE